MDQARYSLWAKRSKPDSNSYILAPPPSQAPVNSYGDSWEEKAFAEDAAGILGGCVWPPRSYSCSFCRREFRSAQALGGHMNVHRRDRARLKQSPISPPHAVEVVPHQNQGTTPCTTHDMSFDASQHSSGIRSFLYNNPNSEIRVSSSPLKSKEEEGPTLSFLTPMFQQNHVIQSLPPQSWSSFISKKRDRFALDLIKNNIVEKEAVTDKDNYVAEDNLSRSLNLVVAFEPTVKASKDDEVASCKKRRIEENPLSLLRKLSGMDKCINYVHQQDDLDLELRLGDAPKVK